MKNFSFTIWIDNEEEEQAIVRRLMLSSKSLCVQKEVGKNGRWHLQGVVVLNVNTAPHDIKRLYPGIWTTTYPNFNISKGVHYCSKPVEDCYCKVCIAARKLTLPAYHVRKGCSKAVPIVKSYKTVSPTTMAMWKEVARVRSSREESEVNQ